MKRLVYLYVANGSADINQIPKWSEKNETQEPFALNFHTEGFAYLFKKFIETKVFDEILVVIESNRSPGSLKFSPGIQILVVPHIECLWPFLRDTDIMWARGGWRTWWAFLDKWSKLDRWLLFYRAASNRGAWSFWDIVLEDLRSDCLLDSLDRFYFPINKPTNPDLFFPIKTERIYDVCVGSSHVHDKKGQWRILDICEAYEKKYKEKLQCILPGSIHHGLKTSELVRQLANFGQITVTGMIPRDQMRTVYNQSKLFVHLGAGGQNDRGPLEAMACGTPVALSNEEFHAPTIRSDRCPFSFHIDQVPEIAASQIYEILALLDEPFRSNVANWHEYKNGVEKGILPQFTFLFDLLKKNDRSNKETVLNQLTAYSAENAYKAV